MMKFSSFVLPLVLASALSVPAQAQDAGPLHGPRPEDFRRLGPRAEDFRRLGPDLPSASAFMAGPTASKASSSGHEHEFLSPRITPYIWPSGTADGRLAGPPTPVTLDETRLAGPKTPAASTVIPLGPRVPAEEVPIAYGFVFPVGGETSFQQPDENGSAPFRLVRGFNPGGRGGDKHMGVDLSNRKQGSQVRAIADGIVAMVCDRTAGDPMHTGWGNMVVLAHKLPGGEVVYSLLAHLKDRSIHVRPGDRVAAGQAIAEVGSTGHAEGPHLHLEMRKFLDWDALNVLPNGWQHMGFLNPLNFLSNHLLKFPDLPEDHWAYPYVMTLVKLGVLPAGTSFGPDDPITGSEFAELMTRAFGSSAPKVTASGDRPLPLASAIGTVLQALRTPGSVDDNSARQSFWLKASLEKATGKPVRDYSHGITRAEAAVLVDAALEADNREPDAARSTGPIKH